MTNTSPCDYAPVPVTIAERTAWQMNDVLTPAYMVTMTAEIDATPLDELRKKRKAEHGTAPSWTALVIKGASLTMQQHPEANRAILGPPLLRRLVQFSATDVSVAVEKSLPALPGAAFATPIRNAIGRSLGDISEQLKFLASCDESTSAEYRLYRRILRYVPPPLSTWLIHAPSWFPSLWAKYRGSACWVNAPSKSGADLVTTTWPWPLTFSFGVVKMRPFVVDSGAVEARLTMPLVLSFDRRVMGGGPAGRLFASFRDILQNRIPQEA